MWLKSKAGTYIYFTCWQICLVGCMMHVLKCLKGQLKCIPALGPEGQTFSKTGPSVKEWEHFLTWTSIFPFFFAALLFGWKEDRRVIQPMDLHWPKVLIPASGVDPLLVQIILAAEKAARLWHLIPTWVCLCSHVHFPSTPLIFGIACACLVDTSLLMTEFHGCGQADEDPVRIGYIQEFTYFL